MDMRRALEWKFSIEFNSCTRREWKIRLRHVLGHDGLIVGSHNEMVGALAVFGASSYLKYPIEGSQPSFLPITSGPAGS